ncbi:MAG TPA: sodium:proton antiporter, partial [Clostridium sp.]|nr:sodium:proton antiporter [Clostridium sp.]
MLALLKLSPVIVMAGLMMLKVDALLAAPIATIYAALIARLTEKLKFDEIVDCAVDNVKSMQLVFFIL